LREAFVSCRFAEWAIARDARETTILSR
jgi:hypothetical protein